MIIIAIILVFVVWFSFCLVAIQNLQEDKIFYRAIRRNLEKMRKRLDNLNARIEKMKI